MSIRPAIWQTIAAALLALIPLAGVQAAPGQVRAGEFTIHYNALSADALPVASTRAYGLRHASDQGLVIIAVNAGHDAASHNVPLTVNGHASTLLGDPLPLAVRYINDGHGHHSALVTFDLTGGDTVRFDLDVTAQGGPTTHLHFVHSYVP